MENIIISSTGTAIDPDYQNAKDYKDVLLALRMLKHAKKVGWPIAEANDLYRGLKLLKIGLPFNLGDHASKALILDYLRNYDSSVQSENYQRNELTLSDGFVTYGTPYVFNIPLTGKDGAAVCDVMINKVSKLIRDKVVAMVKEKSDVKESVANAQVESMMSRTDDFIHNPTSDTFSPLGVSAFECDDSHVVAFVVMDVLDFGVSQTPAAYKKLYEISHEVLSELNILNADEETV